MRKAKQLLAVFLSVMMLVANMPLSVFADELPEETQPAVSEATEENAETETSEVVVEPTIEPTIEPTAEPTVEPTIEPTAEPTAEPTVEPTIEPTAEPTAEPTVESTVEPTAEPTIEPTVELTSEPVEEEIIITEEPELEVEEVEVNNATSGTCGENLTWKFDESTGTLTISGSGDMTSFIVNEVTNTIPWLYYNNNIYSIVFAGNITSIGSYAFWYCNFLTSITIPDSVTSIGEYAFQYAGLSSVYIPGSVKNIGIGAFDRCISLTDVTLGDGVKNIGKEAFHGCNSLTRITIPNSVSNLGAFLFDGCLILSDIYYLGTEEEWNNLYIADYHSPSTNPTVHYHEHIFVDYIENDDAVEPTCTEEGKTASKTAVCAGENCTKTDTFEGEVIPVLGHNFTNYVYDNNATCTENGTETAECENGCGTKDTRTAEGTALGAYEETCLTDVVISSSDYPESNHNYSNDEDKTYWYKYSGAQSITITFSTQSYTEENYDYISVIDKNLNQIAKYTGNEMAGVTLTINGDEFGINLSSDSSQTYYGFSLSNITVTALSKRTQYRHIFRDYNVVKEATCTVDGLMSAQCVNCSETNEIIIPAGHSYTRSYNTDTNTIELVCLACGDSITESTAMSGKCGDDAYWCVDSTGTLLISGTGIIDENEHDQYPWYNCGDSIYSVVIEEGILNIPSYAFGCDSEGYNVYLNLASLKLASTVREVSAWAFGNDTSLTNVKLPDSLRVIGDGAFCNTSIKDVTIPDKCTTIGTSAFCSDKLDHIVLPGKLTNLSSSGSIIGSNLITAGPVGGNYDIEFNWTTTIPAYAFTGLTNLDTITIPGTVTSIGQSATEGTSLSKVIFEGSLSDWHNVVIGENNNTLLNVQKEFTSYEGKCGDNLSFNMDSKGVLTISGTGDMWNFTYLPSNHPWKDFGHSIKSVVIEEGVTSVGAYAFRTEKDYKVEYDVAPNLQSISFPSTMELIGLEAFRGTALQSVTLPSSLCRDDLSMSSGARLRLSFAYCDNLTEVIIPELSTYLTLFNTFMGSPVSHVVINQNTDNMIAGFATFGGSEISTVGPIGSGCDMELNFGSKFDLAILRGHSYHSVTIPANVTEICDSESLLGYSVDEIIFEGGKYEWSKINIVDDEWGYGNTMSDCDTLTDWIYSHNITYLVNNGSVKTTSDTDLVWTIDNDVLSFEHKSDSVADAYDNYSNDWHEYASTVKSIVYAENISSVGAGFFSGFKKLRNVTLPEGLTEIRANAFEGCISLEEITIPSTVTVIADDTVGGVPFDSYTILNVYSGSYAQTWAEEHGYDYEILDGASILAADVEYNNSISYSGSALTPAVKVSVFGKELISGTDYTVTYSNNIKVGTGNITIIGKGKYFGTKTFTFKIVKGTPKVTAPVAKTGLKYTGSAQTLITAGTTTGGTLQYALGENGTYSTTLPKATNAGSYKVYYKVVGNTNYNAVTAKYITVTVAKKTPTVTAPVAKKLTYTGSAQALVTAGTTTGGTLKYCLTSGGTYSTTIPKKTNVGIYKVYYKVVGNTNYNGTTAKSITVNILPKKATVSSYKNTNTGIKLTWGKVTGATGYYVYRGTTKIKTVTSGSTVTYTDTAVKDKANGTKFTYYVQAYYKNSAGTVIKGAKSTGKATYRMKAPASLTLTAGTKYITVTVPKVSGVGYEIWRATSSMGTYTKVIATTSNTYKNTGLTSGKTYYYKVRTYKTIDGVKVYSDYCTVKYAKAK